MTYLDLVREWETDAKANGLVDIKFDRGDSWNDATLEERCEAFCEIMTGPETDVSLENL